MVNWQAATVVLVALLIGLTAVGMIYSSMALIRKALRDVVRLFRDRGATDPGRAITVDELGLVPRDLMHRMFLLRDYRPYALRILIDSDVIRATDEDALYLSEADLERSRLRDSRGTE